MYLFVYSVTCVCNIIYILNNQNKKIHVNKIIILSKKFNRLTMVGSPLICHGKVILGNFGNIPSFHGFIWELMGKLPEFCNLNGYQAS